MPSEIHTASCRDDRSHLRRNMQPPVYRRMGSFGCTVFPSGLFGQALTVKGETEGFDIFDFKLRYYSGTDMVKMNLLRIEGEEAYLRFEKQPEDENECAFFFLLQTILYLVSSKPDIVEHRPAKRQAKAVGRASNKNTTEAITVSEIGIRYGKAIRKRRQMEISGHPADAAVSDGAGRQAARKPMASHVRSAHWHHYWTGKGRTTLSVKWIPPTFVSAHGKELPITIHKITD